MKIRKSIIIVSLLALISNIRLVEWDKSIKSIFKFLPEEETINDFYYFILNDLMWIIILNTIYKLSKKDLLIRFVLAAAYGKLIDEFTNPQGYHLGELVWDISWLIYIL